MKKNQVNKTTKIPIFSTAESWLDGLSVIAGWFLTISIGFSILYAYLLVEITTLSHAKKIDLQLYCNPDQNFQNFKYSKILKFQKHRNTAKIVCIFKNPAENQLLELNLVDRKWTVVSRKFLNVDKSFYWPIYL